MKLTEGQIKMMQEDMYAIRLMKRDILLLVLKMFFLVLFYLLKFKGLFTPLT